MSGSDLDGWFIGNILFGGIIGVVVDCATGAGFKLEKSYIVARLSAIGAGRVLAPPPVEPTAPKKKTKSLKSKRNLLNSRADKIRLSNTE